MNKSLFILICGYLMCTATMTVYAQNDISVEQSNATNIAPVVFECIE